MTRNVFNFFSSLKLTVVLLVLGCVLVFWGTLAQVHVGLYKAQNEFFRSFFIYWGPKSASWKIPIFPAGYLVGGILLINLVTAHFKRFRLSREKVGIWMVHVGLILLLLRVFVAKNQIAVKRNPRPNPKRRRRPLVPPRWILG